MLKVDDISFALESLNIFPGDVIMIHGDAIVAAQLEGSKSKKINIFLNEIIRFLGKKGTIVFPSFTYSSTKSEIFDVQKSRSTVGLLSESFRKYDGVTRSKNPIFSVCSFGKYKKDFEHSCVNDCFGEKSCFGLLHSLGGKLINIACNFEVTYLHYVEQKKKISYRYFKKFNGEIIDNGNKSFIETRYFVGNKNINYSMDLDKLKQNLIKEKKFFITSFGRFISTSVTCKDFFEFSGKLLKQNEYALIKENKKNTNNGL